MISCLFVALGGAAGASLRYLTGLLPVREPFLFPVKTFAVNIAGCVAIGVIAALATRSGSLSPKTTLFLKTGVCGGFTTFSTFALETGTLLKSGHSVVAVVYVILSVVAGVLAVLGTQALLSE